MLLADGPAAPAALDIAPLNSQCGCVSEGMALMVCVSGVDVQEISRTTGVGTRRWERLEEEAGGEPPLSRKQEAHRACHRWRRSAESGRCSGRADSEKKQIGHLMAMVGGGRTGTLAPWVKRVTTTSALPNGEQPRASLCVQAAQ